MNLIGEHVDYLGGVVLPAAVDRYTEVSGQGTAGTLGDTTYGRFGTVRHYAIAVLTAKPTAILTNMGNRQRTSTDSDFLVLILSGRHWTMMDARNAVFKTVGVVRRTPYKFTFVR